MNVDGSSRSPTDWISHGLASPHDNVVTSWVPTGFAAYARVLHEVDGYDGPSPVVRWGDVARWSGVVLAPTTQWIDVALPEILPPMPPPWRNQGPREGWLSRVDTAALAAVLDPSGRARSFFGVWSGYGPLIDVRDSLSNDAPPPARYAPQPTLELPWRDYQLYDGTSTGASSFIAAGGRFQSASIWWAADRSWFVASEIDLTATYVGASRDIIGRLLDDPRLETTRSGPDVSIMRRVPSWLAPVIGAAAEDVLATGSTEVEFSMGRLRVTYERRGGGHGWIHTTFERTFGGGGGGGGRVVTIDPEELRDGVRRYIESAVFSMIA